MMRLARREHGAATWRGWWRWGTALILLVGMLGGWLPQAPLAGADGGMTIIVTSPLDTSGNRTICTLRDALTTANNPSAPAGGCVATSNGESGITIAFALGSSPAWTITLGGTLPTVWVGVAIAGPGADRLRIRREVGNFGQFRVLHVDTTSPVAIRGVTITGGDAGTASGGGILQGKSGPLTIAESVLSGNTASEGGGVKSYGDVTVTDSLISANHAAEFSGGGLYTIGSTTVTNSILSGNRADIGGGGGFLTHGAATISGSTVTGNSAGHGGGFLASGATTLTDSTITNNTATWSSGGGFYSGAAVIVTNSLIANNAAPNGGAGGFAASISATVTGSTFSSNRAMNGYGGGFYVNGVALVTNSTFTDNRAFYGGGFFANDRTTVTGSLLSDNAAILEGGGLAGYAALILANSTLRNNTARMGGGLYALRDPQVTASTLVGNRASSDGDGIHARGIPTVTNTIIAGVAGSTTGNCTTETRFTDGGGNISTDATCVGSGTTSLANTEPLLLPLADNGGPTPTYALRGDSPARGLAAPGICAAAPTGGVDQRGVARPTGGPCDSGAYQSDTVIDVAPVALPGGTVGTAYTQMLTASGGQSPHTFVLAGGAPPTGLTLGSTGQLDGTPTTAGPFTFAVTAIDNLGYRGSREYTIVIAAAPTPSPTPSPTPTPTPSPTPSPSPSPIPVPQATVTASVVGAGQLTPAGVSGYAPGSLITYAAIPAAGQLFLGWTLDGQPVGFANPLEFTVSGDRTLVATFVPRPVFADVAGGAREEAIAQLAARGIIRGYADGRFGPADPLLRAQQAALIVRALGWSGEQPTDPAPFSDLGAVDPELQRTIAILAGRGIINGYGDGTYGPADEIVHAQVISFIARAMVQAGYWTAVTQDDPTLYPNVTASSGHRLDLLTFVKYAGALPDRPQGQAWADWQMPASRGWTAQVLWQALASQFGVDRVP